MISDSVFFSSDAIITALVSEGKPIDSMVLERPENKSSFWHFFGGVNSGESRTKLITLVKDSIQQEWC